MADVMRKNRSDPFSGSVRRGVYGGSFDPVHVGHVQLAELAAQHAGLDVVVFVPAAMQPFKRQGPGAEDDHRMAMLALALENHPTLEACDIEIARGGVSYTVDTLRELQRRHPEDKLYFLMGADSLHDLPQWREPEEILRLALPIVVAREGEPAPDWRVLAPLVDESRIEEIRHGMIAETVAHVSSSEVRRRLASGETIEGMLAPAVADYIRQHGLYQEREPETDEGPRPTAPH